MKNILLAGYYGFGNLGDEAILEMVLKELSEVTDKRNITVLSGNKDETSQKYDVDTVDRYNVLAIIKKLQRSHALVFGGGSLLQDVTSKRSIYYYIFLIRLSKLMGKKVIMLSQGIGPIISQRSRKITADTLNKVDCITVRDIQSKEFLEQIGVNKSRIVLSADPVINFRAEDNYIRREREYKKVCFSLRNWQDVDVCSKISSVSKRLMEKGIKCHFIPFYYNEDLPVIKEIQKTLKDDAVYYCDRLSTDEAYDIVREMNLLVGVRLHALIFASAAEVPFVAVSYDHKVDHFVESVNMGTACNIKDFNIDELFDEIIKKLDNEEAERQKLSENVKRLRQIVKVNNKILREI